MTFNEWASPSLSLKRVLAKEVGPSPSQHVDFLFFFMLIISGGADPPSSQHVDVHAKVALSYFSSVNVGFLNIFMSAGGKQNGDFLGPFSVELAEEEPGFCCNDIHR